MEGEGGSEREGGREGDAGQGGGRGVFRALWRIDPKPYSLNPSVGLPGTFRVFGCFFSLRRQVGMAEVVERLFLGFRV